MGRNLTNKSLGSSNLKDLKSQKKNKSGSIKSKNYIKSKFIFNGGENVLYRNHFKSDVKWIPVVVVKKESSVMYLIRILNVLRILH